MRFRIKAFSAAGLALLAALGPLRASEPGKTDTNSPLRFTVADIDGQTVDLARYRGMVVLIVNTASKCGLTPQYEALQAIHEKYSDQGFTVLAFPANNFNNQEPGTNEEIKSFCKVNYSVSFPLFSKISVKGDDIHPLYQYLTSGETNPGFDSEIPWNFTKFLVNRQGKVVARFQPRTKPESGEIIEAVEKALKE